MKITIKKPLAITIIMLAGLALIISLITQSANAKEFTQLSKKNQVLMQNYMPESNSPHVVVEFFSYACPHCYSLEPEIKKWSSTHKDVLFIKMPVSYNGGAWEVLAKAYYISVALGKEKFFSPLIFKEIHVMHKNLNDEEALKIFFVKNGVSAKQFDQLYNSFGITQQLRQNATLVKAINLMSVPILVVDGKYITSPSQAKSISKMFKVIDGLLKPKATEKPNEVVKPREAGKPKEAKS